MYSELAMHWVTYPNRVSNHFVNKHYIYEKELSENSLCKIFITKEGLRIFLFQMAYRRLGVGNLPVAIGVVREVSLDSEWLI